MELLGLSSYFNFYARSAKIVLLAVSLLFAVKLRSAEPAPMPAEIFSGSEELKTPELRQAGVAEAAAMMPNGPYQTTWESLRKTFRTPGWFRDAKFGIFLHWGLYAVPAHGSEWYVRHIYTADSLAEKWHVTHFGPLDKFGYKDFIPLFTAAKWDPDAWARLFKDAGARYVIPTGEHHDGFSLWDSAINPYNAKAMGPKRDLIGDLARAVRKEGLKFGISNHSNIHFNFVPRLEPSDEFDPAWAEFYSVADRSDAARGRFMTKWVTKNLELIDKYQPDMLWFDMSGNDRTWDAQKLAVAAYYYNRALQWGKEVSLSTKGAAYLAGSVKDYERGRAPGILNTAWQEDTSIAHNTWGYTAEIRYRTVGEIVRELVDCVSKNGNFLLNIAPRADGTIPEEQQWRLEAIGEWFRVNGEAIYGTRPWTKYGEGDYRGTFHKNVERGLVDAMLSEFTAKDIRFTTKDGNLYAILLAWPADNTAVITSLGTGNAIPGTVTSVQLLGNKGELHFTRDAEGLKVAMPNPPIRPCDYAFVLKIAGLNAHPEPGVE